MENNTKNSPAAEPKHLKTNVSYLSVFYPKVSKDNLTVCDLTFGLEISKIPVFCNYDELEMQAVYNELAEMKSFQGIREFDDVPYLVFRVCSSTECHHEDDPSDLIGERIALTKAQEKAFNIASRVYKKIFTRAYNELFALGKMKMNCEKIEKNCVTHISELDK